MFSGAVHFAEIEDTGKVCDNQAIVYVSLKNHNLLCACSFAICKETWKTKFENFFSVTSQNSCMQKMALWNVGE